MLLLTIHLTKEAIMAKLVVKLKKKTADSKNLLRSGQSQQGCGWCGHGKIL